MENKKHYKSFVETVKLNAKVGSVETKVKRGDISFNWLLIAYTILLAVFIGVITIIPSLDFLSKLTFIILGAILLFLLCFRNKWSRQKIINLFSKAKEMEEVSKH